jgi:hypothetical protein
MKERKACVGLQEHRLTACLSRQKTGIFYLSAVIIPLSVKEMVRSFLQHPYPHVVNFGTC